MLTPWKESYDQPAAESLQSCPTLCDPIDSSPPGSPVPGILQARTLEWVAISFSNEWKWEVKVKSLGRVRLLATPWSASHQAPLSMGFSRQEYWSGVPLPLCRSPIEWLLFVWQKMHEHFKNTVFPPLCLLVFCLCKCHSAIYAWDPYCVYFISISFASHSLVFSLPCFPLFP